MARRGCPPEIRRRVLDLVERGGRVAEIAADLGINEQTIHIREWASSESNTGRALWSSATSHAAGNRPDVQALVSRSVDSIHNDSLGHADDILVELGRLVWLRAIYDVDLSTYPYDHGYQADLIGIAESIMDAHDPAYDAPHH